MKTNLQLAAGVTWRLMLIAFLSSLPIMLIAGCASKTTAEAERVERWVACLPYNSINIKDIGNDHCVFRWEKQWFIGSMQSNGYVALTKIDEYIPEKWLGESAKNTNAWKEEYLER